MSIPMAVLRCVGPLPRAELVAHIHILIVCRLYNFYLHNHFAESIPDSFVFSFSLKPSDAVFFATACF